jgi:hypothetical protein
VEKIAMAGNREDGSAGAEVPKTRPGPSVSTKLDGFIRGLAKGFSDESRAKKNGETEIAGLGETTVTETGLTQPGTPAEKTSGQESSEPPPRSKLDRFVRSLFTAKPKNDGDTERDGKNNETTGATPPPAPETKAVKDAPAAAKGAPQGLAKMTELASWPAAPRRRLGQRGGRRRSEAIPFIPAVTLTVGESLTLGRTLTDAANCFQKGKNKGWFCLETANWPDEIRDRLRVSTWIYRKARTIVHYRSGRAQRIFSVFPANNFNKVVRFLEAKFGPPAEETDQFIALIGAPPKLNLSVKWKRKNADGSISALEVRKFDNVRRMVPDTNIGFIRLYREGSRPIFRTINESDLMLQRLRNSRLSQNAPKNR